MFKNCSNLYKDVNNLLQLCTCVLCLLGFSGFLGFSELSCIRMSDIVWHDNYRKVNIPQNKTDIYRRRHSMIIGKTGNELCPIYWLKRYILLVGLSLGSEEFVLTAINFFFLDFLRYTDDGHPKQLKMVISKIVLKRKSMSR